MKNTTLLFEVLGCLVLLLLLSWFNVRSPVVMAEIYAVYLRELSVFRFSTHSVFIIGNLIIIVVVVQSAKLSEKTPAHKVHFPPTQKLVHFVRHHQYDVADEQMIFIPLHHVANHKMKYGPQHDLADENMKFTQARHMADQEIKYGLLHDVSIKTTVNMSKEAHLRFSTHRSVSEQSFVPHKSVEAEQMSEKTENSQLYRRTRSASYERGGAKVNKKIKPELMRSRTFKCGGGNEEKVTMAGRFDELNHDEFRRKIESFIAKLRELIREELVDGFSLRR